MLDRLSSKDAGQDLNLISLLTFGCIFALTGFAAVEKGLDVCFGQRKSGRTPVDHYADAGAVGFAPGYVRNNVPNVDPLMMSISFFESDTHYYIGE